MQDTLLSLQHISKNFGEGDVLRDISLDVARGEFVTLPLTMPGILAGCVLVFVPSVGLFYLSDIMGGGLVLVGNLIRDQLLKVRDWNVGSAMSMVLIALSAGIYLLYRKVGGDDLGVM